MSRLWVLWVVFFLGCPQEESSTILFDNEGELCVEDAGVIKVRPNYCLSSSCDTLVSATCTASLDGYTLTLESHAEIEHVGDVCTDDCGLVEATCTFETIQDAESISVVHGSTTVQFDQLPACGAL